MKQHQSPEELYKQALPMIRDLAKIEVQHYGMISVDSLIYAMVRQLALTIAAVCDDRDDYRQWIKSLIDEFSHELRQYIKTTDGISSRH